MEKNIYIQKHCVIIIQNKLEILIYFLEMLDLVPKWNTKIVQWWLLKIK